MCLAKINGKGGQEFEKEQEVVYVREVFEGGKRSRKWYNCIINSKGKRKDV